MSNGVSLDYSNKDFTGHDLSDRTDMSGLLIENSCFSNETPDAHIFPENMTGTTFRYCNLDNIFIPDGNIVEECSTRRFKIQNDGEDWLICSEGTPLEPINAKQFINLGISTDPADIPDEPVDVPVTIVAIMEAQ